MFDAYDKILIFQPYVAWSNYLLIRDTVASDRVNGRCLH